MLAKFLNNRKHPKAGITTVSRKTEWWNQAETFRCEIGVWARGKAWFAPLNLHPLRGVFY